METTWTRRSMCMNVDGFLRNNKFPSDFDIFQKDDGTPLKPEEALTYLHTEKAKGHKVIPCSGSCGNPRKNADKGCTGFDYSGGGCPGYKVPPETPNAKSEPTARLLRRSARLTGWGVAVPSAPTFEGKNDER